MLDDFLRNDTSIYGVSDLICPPNTPFDGGYTRLDLDFNGYPVYRNHFHGWVAKFSGTHWYFEGPDVGNMTNLIEGKIDLFVFF